MNIVGSEGPITVRETADSADIWRSQAQRMLKTMFDEGVVERRIRETGKIGGRRPYEYILVEE